MKETVIHTVYLGIGTNLGEKKKNLDRAVSYLNETCGNVVSVSSVYESNAVGFESNYTFFNQCICMKTLHKPKELLFLMMDIEKKMGRKRIQGMIIDRIIDLDILLFNELIIKTPSLAIPHPKIQERNFVLEPLSEIAPDVIHPVLKQSIKSLKDNSKDISEVRKIIPKSPHLQN